MPTQNKRKHIPAELIEKILLDLPVKSLCRFSTVSKSWNLMINGREFVQRYQGREMIVLRAYSDDENEKGLVFPLSSISSAAAATPFVRPFKADTYVSASCGYLWCVEFGNSLLLYNPSMQAYRKLPVPSASLPIGTTIETTAISVFVYGLGYDSVADDYKIIKIHRENYVETELYSLRNDYWRKIKSPPHILYEVTFLSSKGVFVSGALHWLVNFLRRHDRVTRHVILSFDLSKENYEILKLPRPPNNGSFHLTVFGGKLRVCLNYARHTRFAAWVMNDYESKSWTREMEINYAHIHPLSYARLRPFYFYDRDGNVIKAVTSSKDLRKIFVCKEEEDGSSSLVEKDFGSNGCGTFEFDTYIESLVSVRPGGS